MFIVVVILFVESIVLFSFVPFFFLSSSSFSLCSSKLSPRDFTLMSSVLNNFWIFYILFFCTGSVEWFALLFFFCYWFWIWCFAQYTTLSLVCTWIGQNSRVSRGMSEPCEGLGENETRTSAFSAVWSLTSNIASYSRMILYNKVVNKNLEIFINKI